MLVKDIIVAIDEGILGKKCTICQPCGVSCRNKSPIIGNILVDRREVGFVNEYFVMDDKPIEQCEAKLGNITPTKQARHLKDEFSAKTRGMELFFNLHDNNLDL